MTSWWFSPDLDVVKLIHTEQKKERGLHKLTKKVEGWNISNKKRGLPKRGIQEKGEGEGMPDFFYCLKYKADIATL